MDNALNTTQMNWLAANGIETELRGDRKGDSVRWTERVFWTESFRLTHYLDDGVVLFEDLAASRNTDGEHQSRYFTSLKEALAYAVS